MARQFDDALAQYLVRFDAVVPGYPFTVSVHFLVDDPLDSPYFFGLGSGGGIHDAFALRNGTGRTLQAWARSADVPADAGGATANSWTAGVWQHACGIYATAAERTAVLNGDWGARGVGTAAVAPGPVNRTALAALVRTSPMGFLGGRLAEAAVWSAALSEAEAAALARGISPRLVRPQALAAHWPLDGPPGQVERDAWKHRRDLTPVNVPLAAPHPRRFAPCGPRMAGIGAAPAIVHGASAACCAAACQVHVAGGRTGQVVCSGTLAGEIHA